MPRRRYKIEPERIAPEGLDSGFESRFDYQAGDTFEYGRQRFLIDAVEDEADAPDFEGHAIAPTRVLHCRLTAN